jgi:hypothetical protein
MKRISGLVFLLTIQTVQSGEPYSLKTIEQNPIPKKKFFLLWDDVAREMCEREYHYTTLSAPDCKKLMVERSGSCIKKIERQTPAMVADKTTSKRLARLYLYCAFPGVFCNGVEVKNEEQSRNHCLDPNQPPMG